VRRTVLAAAGASMLAPLLVLAACPSLGDIGGGPDGSADHVADVSRMKDAGVEASCDASLGADPHNCGRCEHDCLGGGCTKGTCDPVLIYTGNTPSSIVVDGSTLFVTVLTYDPNDGYVFRCNAENCQTDNTLLATAQRDPWFAVQQGADLYWADYSGLDATTEPGIVAGCPERGCPDSGPLVYSPDGGGVDAGTDGGEGVVVTGLTADLTYIYWAAVQNGTGAIFRCVPSECAGTLAKLIETADSVPYALAVDATNLYWINVGLDQVVRCELPCSGSSVIVADIALAGVFVSFSGLAVYGGNLYWTEGVVDGGGVYSCPTTGCAHRPTQIAGAQADAIFLAADDSGLYWANIAGGTIMHCPIEGCAKPNVIASVPAPLAIALDPVSVYFTSSPGFAGSGLGKVFRVAK
jgi:hypothetical protein